MSQDSSSRNRSGIREERVESHSYVSTRFIPDVENGQLDAEQDKLVHLVHLTRMRTTPPPLFI